MTAVGFPMSFVGTGDKTAALGFHPKFLHNPVDHATTTAIQR